MAETIYDEDRFYTDDWLTSPQKTRSVWGAPEPWMKWGGGGAMNASTDWDYSGLREQDKTMPFVLYGGGFDVYQKYIGPYSMICGDDNAPILNDDINWNGTIEPFIKYFSFGGAFVRLIRKSDGYEYHCRIYPTNWRDMLERSIFFSQSPFYVEGEKEFEQQWHAIASAQKMVIVDGAEYGEKYIAKIEEMTDSKVTLFISYIGNEEGMFSQAFHYRMFFDIPEEVKPFRHLIKQEEISYLNLSPWTSTGLATDPKNRNSATYLIFKSGVYLRLWENIWLNKE